MRGPAGPTPRDVPMWRRYLRLLGPDVQADVDDELAFHIDMRARELIALGLSADDARAEAERRFGNRRQVRDACRNRGRPGATHDAPNAAQ